ncbi:hypothetical protein HDG32_000884 [Paraburkholderia sp. CI2]|uniref:hypothetical protein n=1 Tax=Paraburkholderia sp. CI2 TaxID=2723093 RepID=UPI001621EE0B|nr:hypothetical protein [Paraburkholderia sp. CI2]MBB5464790.1 hypothetical protein [Paraburkholderia sp. CI2]
MALEQGSGETSMLALGIVGFCGLAFACSIAVMACLLKVRRDGFGTAIDHRQTESVVGALSRGAIGTSIFMTCLAALLLSAALHIYLN